MNRKLLAIISGALALACVLTLIIVKIVGNRHDRNTTIICNDPSVENGEDVSDLYDNVTLYRYDDLAFFSDGNFITYSGSDAVCKTGVDVSNHNGDIDWQAVAGSGIDFAMISVGYRGYTEGSLNLDTYFTDNIEGALAAGLDVGVYFFSQAVTMAEAEEEAEFVLAHISGYDISYPVVFDWETVTSDTGRTHGMNTATVTNCAIAFCHAISEAGYCPMVYFNKTAAAVYYDLSRLTAFDYWLASYSDIPGFSYDFQMWQYSCTGEVDGIDGDVDLNLCFSQY